MNAMARGKHGYLSVYVPTKAGGLVQRSTGTHVGHVVRGMQRMVRDLKDGHRWVILDALTIATVGTGKRKRPALSLKDAYAYYTSNALAELEAKLTAKNLALYLDGWIKWVRGNRRADVETADVYWQQVTTLVAPDLVDPKFLDEKAERTITAVYFATSLTNESALEWLTTREKASSGTKRKYFYALKSFINYLVIKGVYPADPISALKAPKKNPAKEMWVTADVDEAIVKDSILKYHAFFAFIKGTGADVGSARRALIADVNLFAGKTDIRGTKTPARKVHGATIEPWALPYVRAQVNARRKLNDGPKLFPGMGKKPPSKHHAIVCKRLGIEGYNLKDARHSVGVRMRLAGKTFEEIAAQLGTSVFHVVTVYARFQPEDVPNKEEAK